jgi:hypothetical protein
MPFVVCIHPTHKNKNLFIRSLHLLHKLKKLNISHPNDYIDEGSSGMSVPSRTVLPLSSDTDDASSPSPYSTRVPPSVPQFPIALDASSVISRVTRRASDAASEDGTESDSAPDTESDHHSDISSFDGEARRFRDDDEYYDLFDEPQAWLNVGEFASAMVAMLGRQLTPDEQTAFMAGLTPEEMDPFPDIFRELHMYGAVGGITDVTLASKLFSSMLHMLNRPVTEVEVNTLMRELDECPQMEAHLRLLMNEIQAGVFAHGAPVVEHLAVDAAADTAADAAADATADAAADAAADADAQPLFVRRMPTAGPGNFVLSLHPSPPEGRIEHIQFMRDIISQFMHTVQPVHVITRHLTNNVLEGDQSSLDKFTEMLMVSVLRTMNMYWRDGIDGVPEAMTPSASSRTVRKYITRTIHKYAVQVAGTSGSIVLDAATKMFTQFVQHFRGIMTLELIGQMMETLAMFITPSVFAEVETALKAHPECAVFHSVVYSEMHVAGGFPYLKEQADRESLTAYVIDQVMRWMSQIYLMEGSRMFENVVPIEAEPDRTHPESIVVESVAFVMSRYINTILIAELHEWTQQHYEHCREKYQPRMVRRVVDIVVAPVIMSMAGLRPSDFNNMRKLSDRAKVFMTVLVTCLPLGGTVVMDSDGSWILDDVDGWPIPDEYAQELNHINDYIRAGEVPSFFESATPLQELIADVRVIVA